MLTMPDITKAAYYYLILDRNGMISPDLTVIMTEQGTHF